MSKTCLLLIFLLAIVGHCHGDKILRADRAADVFNSSTVVVDRVARQTSSSMTPSQCSFGRGHELTGCDWNLTDVESVGSIDSHVPAWQLSSGRTSYFRGGPSTDASGDQDGGYLLMDTLRGVAETIKLSSMMINATLPEGRCVVFQYAMDGPSADRLRLVLRQSQLLHQMANDTVLLMPRREVLWEGRSDSSDKWLTASVLYSHGQPHQLAFEAVVDNSVQSQRRLRGHFVLDNVDLGTWKEDENEKALNENPDTLMVDPCLGHCNFDGGFCGWSNDQDDDFDWNLGRGSLNAVTGPIAGHLSRGYAYIDSGYPRRPGDRARLLSPFMEPTDPDQPLCLRFWTHMFGNGIGMLKVVQLFGPPGSDISSKELWSLTGESSNNWHQGQITVSSNMIFRIAFEATTGRNHLGDIAIDDVSFDPGPRPSAPQAAAAPTQQNDCNFETDECGWTNAVTRENMDDIDWIRHPAENSRLQFVKDHTTYTSKGYVMSPGRSPVQRPGDRALLFSRPFNVTSGKMDMRCMTFWYLMNEPIIDPTGPSLGSLRIYTRREEAFSGLPLLGQMVAVWRLHNHQAGVWKMGRALIQQTGNYRVVIEGLWGSSRGAGSISIDDISFYEGSCSTHPNQAMPMATECNFDRDMCSWRSIANTTGVRQDTDWRLATAARRPANLPDHTFGAPSGYVYFDVFSQQNRQEVIRLVGPNMTSGGIGRPRLCLTFWFAAFGAGDTTQLRVLMMDSVGGSEKEIWMLRVVQLESTRPDWNFGQVELESDGTNVSGQEVKLVYEGRASNGGFAVDDITIYQGGCKTRPKFATPIS
ncbi:hypothetical protein OUZ56_030380 [Daphnia magna]|uniref:MAM domain-containing protein n=1 Tax=Daphnia magna TaxID=35525 RepID=A0ABQ9ZS01_9CRUS|nr:hypothetical protein OUZ56_030380 [Daphnia magna]